MIEDPSNVRVVPAPLPHAEVYIRAGEKLMIELAERQKRGEKLELEQHIPSTPERITIVPMPMVYIEAGRRLMERLIAEQNATEKQ